MVHLTKDLKLDFLGWIPRFEDQFIDSQSIIAFSALLTFKGKAIKALYQEVIDKEQNVKKKVRTILQRSSLRGHASLSTTPNLAISFQGTKFLDSMLTGTIFSSSLMASGRRTKTSLSDIVYPASIYKGERARFSYQKQMEKNINFLNHLIDADIPQDAASKIMPYGMVGTGIIVLPIESLIGFERELETQGKWMPDDGTLFIYKVKKQLKKFGLDDLYYTRKAAPRNVYPYPNIFKDPKLSNLARDFSKKLKPGKLSAIVSFESLVTPKLLKRLKKLNGEIEAMAISKTKIKSRWYKNLLKRKELCRDYNLALSLSMISAVSWRVWGEKKRHRTVPQAVDSIYASVNRALKVFKKAYPQIKAGKINDKLIKEIDFVFTVPKGLWKTTGQSLKTKRTVLNNQDSLLKDYLIHAADSFFTYQKLVKAGMPEREAIYVIPRGIRIFVLQKFDLYNLISGYYPLRLCPTAEEQMRRRTEEELIMIKKLLQDLGGSRHAELGSASSQILKRVQDDRKGGGLFDDLLSLIAPKCHLVGFCPEQKFCGKIKTLVPYYNEEFHQEMKKELEKKFLEEGTIKTPRGGRLKVETSTESHDSSEVDFSRKQQ